VEDVCELSVVLLQLFYKPKIISELKVEGILDLKEDRKGEMKNR
jgi:hypothetical protein